MIQRDFIIKLLEEVVTEPHFLVELVISPSNGIEVIVDGDKGIDISKCVQISRHVEGNLDREAEDFSLSVTSPGLGNPFKVKRQYLKNIGQELEVIIDGGKPLVGKLTSVDDEGFEIETTAKEKIEGKNKKETVVRLHKVLFSQGAKVKNIVSFK